jgi:hypothetical protein
VAVPKGGIGEFDGVFPGHYANSLSFSCRFTGSL